ncbi:unnamed protein product [Cunninghamella echinulata]
MSMLNKLKETAVNPVFMDEDEDDIDNMDFPLPTNNDQRPSSSMPQGMPQANGGGAGPSSAASQASPYATTSRSNVTVASGPNGVQRLILQNTKIGYVFILVILMLINLLLKVEKLLKKKL